MNNLKIQNSSTTSLKASFNATARAINDVYASGTDQIKNLAAGKTPADATSSIKAKFTSIHAVNVSTSPDIFAGIDPWITFWQSHINVKIVPDATANSK